MSEAMSIKKVPVVLLSGFLGAGKTTMLKHILENKAGLRVGAVVNDVAAVNIDAKLTREVSGMSNDTVQLQNGCACCSASEELFVSVEQLIRLSIRRRARYDYVIIEGSGVSEPKMIRERFQQAEEQGLPILRLVFLSTMVTVVDAASFPKLFETRDTVEDRPELGVDDFDEGSGERSIVDLLTEQVECADMIVLNKTDLVEKQAIESLRKVLAALNMGAEVRCCEWGKVPLELVLKAEREVQATSSTEAVAPNALLSAECDTEDDHRKMIQAALAQQALDGDGDDDCDDCCSGGASKRRKTSHDHSHGHKHGHEHGHDNKHTHDHKLREYHGTLR